MLDDESGKAKGYLSLHSVCGPVNSKLGLEFSSNITFLGIKALLIRFRLLVFNQMPERR
jgi:hypothetical protein